MNMDALVQVLAAAIGNAIGSLLGGGATVDRGEGGDPRWIAQLTVTGPVNGTLHVGLPSGDGSALARAVMALDEPPADDSVRDTLLEVCGQAIGALSQMDGFTGLRLAQCVVVDAVPASASVVYQVSVGDRFTGAIHIWTPSAAAPAALTSSLPARDVSAEPAMPVNLDVILDIDLPLAVRFGETEMTLASLTRLAPGSVIDLGRSPEDPVDGLVNGRLIARAEVVVVAGNYGVRITEVISAADRLRSVAL